MVNDTQKGLFLGAAQIFSFIISGLIGAILGFSITNKLIPAALYAIFGGFIGQQIFFAWWRAMKSSKIARTLKAVIFTVFTVIVIAGIVIIVYINI